MDRLAGGGQTGGWWVNEAGTYQIKGKAYAVYVPTGQSATLNRNPFSFSVVDNYAPAIPDRVGGSTSNNHPKITWGANTELDLQNYSVYKKDGTPSYVFRANTNNTYYVDNSETIYTGGGNKTWIYYKVKANDINGNSSNLSSSVSFAVNEPISKIAANGDFDFGTPKDYKLNANYPNPFNPTTTISYQFPQSGHATLRIYNSLGEVVAEALNGFEEAGFYSVVFNASHLPSGMYFATLQINGFTSTQKMILMK